MRKLGYATGVFAMFALVACGDIASPTSVVESVEVRAAATAADTAMHIFTTGNVVLAEGSALELTATRHTDGRVTGVWVVPDARIGSPVEVVAPSDQYDWWCVNTVVENEPNLEGFNIIIYVRDIGNGLTRFDELGTSGGFGINCTSNPSPSRLFQPLQQGDFRTRVRTR